MQLANQRRVLARGLHKAKSGAPGAVSKLLTNNLRGVEKRLRNLPSSSPYLREKRYSAALWGFLKWIFKRELKWGQCFLFLSLQLNFRLVLQNTCFARVNIISYVDENTPLFKYFYLEPFIKQLAFHLSLILVNRNCPWAVENEGILRQASSLQAKHMADCKTWHARLSSSNRENIKVSLVLPLNCKWKTTRQFFIVIY